MSLRGGLLRLMMAGFIFIVFNPTSFEVQFILSEIISYLSLHIKEGMIMCIKILRENVSYIKQLVKNAIISWQCHLSYRFNLLMIW